MMTSSGSIYFPECNVNNVLPLVSRILEDIGELVRSENGGLHKRQ